MRSLTITTAMVLTGTAFADRIVYDQSFDVDEAVIRWTGHRLESTDAVGQFASGQGDGVQRMTIKLLPKRSYALHFDALVFDHVPLGLDGQAVLTVRINGRDMSSVSLSSLVDPFGAEEPHADQGFNPAIPDGVRRGITLTFGVASPDTEIEFVAAGFRPDGGRWGVDNVVITTYDHSPDVTGPGDEPRDRSAGLSDEQFGSGARFMNSRGSRPSSSSPFSLLPDTPPEEDPFDAALTDDDPFDDPAPEDPTQAPIPAPAPGTVLLVTIGGGLGLAARRRRK